MADPNEFDEFLSQVDKEKDQEEPPIERNLWMRLFYMILIAVMLSVASTVLGVMTIIQFVIMLFNKGEPNENIAGFGTDLGIWIAKSARYQTADSETKPWPWSQLD